MKVMTVVGTRPELIKLSCVIQEFDRHFDQVLVHTGQNYDYELNKVFFDELGLREPDYFLNSARKSATKTIACILDTVEDVLEKEKPEVFVVYGDTNSCLSALAAKKRKIPVFHLEAGNRCFDDRVPEEINRRVLDHISDINLVLTEHARRYLIAEGIAAETIIKIGSNMVEVLNRHKQRIGESKILSKLGLAPFKYFVASIHREENVDVESNVRLLIDSLEYVVDQFKLPIVVSLHPRTRQRMEDLGLQATNSDVVFVKPFGFFDYINLQQNAMCVLSDSGTITEESSILNFPAVTVRQQHERPEGMDKGTVIMSGLEPLSVVAAVKMAIEQHSWDYRVFPPVPDYLNPSASKHIARIVLSYRDFVNRTVWKVNY